MHPLHPDIYCMHSTINKGIAFTPFNSNSYRLLDSIHQTSPLPNSFMKECLLTLTLTITLTLTLTLTITLTLTLTLTITLTLTLTLTITLTLTLTLTITLTFISLFLHIFQTSNRMIQQIHYYNLHFNYKLSAIINF